MAEKPPLLQFSTFSSMVDPTFWHKLNQIKLDEDRLEEKERLIWGSFSNIDSEGYFSLDAASFNKTGEVGQKHAVLGALLNFNTIEAFKECDKSDLIQKYAARLEQSWSTEKDEAPKFILISFADLKKYHFYYWFAFLAPKTPTTYVVETPQVLTKHFNDQQISKLESSLNDCGKSFCVQVKSDDTLEVQPLSSFGDLRSSGSRVLLGFSDPSPLAEAPGWPLRSLIKEVVNKWPSTEPEVEVLCLRLSNQGPRLGKSVVLKVGLEDVEDGECQWLGWERNERAKLGPRLANLSNSMDPKKLAECAVDLNLKLMKWRLLPQIDLDIVKNCKCLLLGAGTLGCAVARVLLGWGVRKITFVDCGRVSYSNPVRQSLFLHQHCLGAGALKAKAAAESLVAIFPGVEAEGVELSIPMPGHSLVEAQHEQVKKDVEQLQTLVTEHDAIFLLTDSRESRWLPTVLCKSQNKLVINAALGFDSYLVMRHGVSCGDDVEEPEAASCSSSSSDAPPRSKNIPGSQLGCYFCNDVVAPRNSMSQRSLDQQCTVVRPGVSQIAAALAVELLVSILQHPKQGGAPANCDPDQLASESGSPLGILPHSIRGYLAQMQTILPATQSFPQCAACSPLIVDELRSRGFDFLLQVFNCPGYLENLTGLSELQKRSDEAEIWALSDSEDENE